MNEILLEGSDLLKIYGPTTAVNHLHVRIYKGEVLALVGANGAGKSTLTKILSGVVKSDSGSIRIDGKDVDMNRYSTAEARQLGIRVVHQELSLCKNLTVYENFYVEQSDRFSGEHSGWRNQARKLAQESLDKVFPGHGINVNAGLASLSIAQQQMVEIARAASSSNLKLLIMDEPTSSLPAHETEQLEQYIKNDSRENGVAYIYISHRLDEIMYLADHVFIMQNGTEKHYCAIDETSIDDMVERMGQGVVAAEQDQKAAPKINKDIYVKFDDFSSRGLHSLKGEMYGGEIVILTGLEGNGQLDVLREIFQNAKKKKSGLQIGGKVAFVAGDRKKEGILPLWSIKDNTIISSIADNPLFKPISVQDADDIVEKWNGRLKTKYASKDDLITSLSGGNQQKVLIARAFAENADIILLDDPTRGVDIGTKLELYSVFHEAAEEGKLIIWRTSDDAELNYCTRLIVMNNGSIAGECSHDEINHAQILKWSFYSEEKTDKGSENGKKAKSPKLYLFSLIAMLLLYVVCGIKSPVIFSKFGIELLATGFAPFIFALLGQTFMIGLGHIDFGIGAFMGLINVVCATVLSQNTFLGILLLAGLVGLYSSMGLLVYWKGIPPIIITLGMSFVWLGLGYVIQPSPGGSVPAWMVTLFNFNNPVLQGILIWLIALSAVAILFYRSRYGTVLRGFGNNVGAMQNSGWSTMKAYWVTYLVAGSYAAMGGIAQSAITTASDINASSTYTMLTVAAVIIGGGYFSGGVVTHIGAIFGGISLTMISVLLGLFRISTDYTATIQGLVLILILSLRLIRKEDRNG